MTAEPVEVVVIPTPSKRSTSTEKRTKIQMKPISEQAVAMSVEREREDPTSESTKPERLPVVDSWATNDSHFAEPNPPIAASGVVDHEVEAGVASEAVGTVTQVRQFDEKTMLSY